MWSHHGLRQFHDRELPLRHQIGPLRQEMGLTIFMVVLAAFSALLYRLTGQDDLLLGSPVAGRQTPGAELLIGFFVNTVVLRAQLEPGMTFRQLLAQVKARVLRVYDHQQLPFDRLVEELAPKRDLSYPPVYQVMFALHNVPLPPVTMKGVKSEQEYIQNGASQVDLILFVGQGTDDEKEDIPQFEYNTDLFDATTMQRWLIHLELLTEAMIADPDQPVAAVSLLSDGQRQQLLVE